MRLRQDRRVIPPPFGNPVYYRWVPRHSTAFWPVNWVLMRRLFRQCSAENFPHLEESTEPGGRLGQFSHNGIVPVVETVLQLVQVRSDRRLLFSQSLLSFLGLLLRAALRPGNRPCTGEVPVPDKDGRWGGLRPPHPSKTFFRCWGKAAAARSWRGWARAGPSPARPAALSGGHRAGVFSGAGTSAPFAPLFAVRLPLTHTCRLLNGRRSGPGTVRLILGASCGPLSPWIEPGPGANVSLFPTKDLRGAAN